MSKLLNPLGDNLGSSLLTGGKRKAPKPRRRSGKEPKEPPVTFAEADEAWYRVRAIYGSQEKPNA